MKEMIGEVRALLAQFEKSTWRDLHLRAGGWEMFFARQGGSANPMGAAPAPVATGGERITAPHLGLFTAARAIGDTVAVGDTIGRLAVLDEIEEIVTNRAGAIVAIAADGGALVEYGAELVRIG